MPFLSNKKKSLLPAMRIKLPIASKKDLVLKEHNNPTSRNNLGQCSSKLICHENAKIQLTCGKENEFPTTLSAQFEWQSKTKSESFPIMQQTGHQHEDESNSVIKGALPRGVVCDSAWNPKQPPLEPPAHTAKHFDIVKPGDEHIFMTERTEGFLSRQKSKLQSARPSLPVSFREARASFREARAKASLKTKTTRSVHPEPFSISPAAGMWNTDICLLASRRLQRCDVWCVCRQALGAQRHKRAQHQRGKLPRASIHLPPSPSFSSPSLPSFPDGAVLPASLRPRLRTRRRQFPKRAGKTGGRDRRGRKQEDGDDGTSREAEEPDRHAEQEAPRTIPRLRARSLHGR